MKDPLVERIEGVIGPSIADMGFELVRVAMIQGRRQTVQVMAERADRAPMTVEDCADISRTISVLLDVEDPVSGEYQLEVSSPGIDRPLTRLEDYERFAGFEAKIEMAALVDGRRRYRGRIGGVADGMIRLEAEDGTVHTVAFEGIRSAKLVLTDALIEATQSQQV